MCAQMRVDCRRRRRRRRPLPRGDEGLDVGVCPSPGVRPPFPCRRPCSKRSRRAVYAPRGFRPQTDRKIAENGLAEPTWTLRPDFRKNREQQRTRANSRENAEACGRLFACVRGCSWGFGPQTDRKNGRCGPFGPPRASGTVYQQLGNVLAATGFAAAGEDRAPSGPCVDRAQTAPPINHDSSIRWAKPRSSGGLRRR
jgi:hypothetical protein